MIQIDDYIAWRRACIQRLASIITDPALTEGNDLTNLKVEPITVISPDSNPYHVVVLVTHCKRSLALKLTTSEIDLTGWLDFEN